MGRCLLCTKEAETPYEVDGLDLRIYSIEELSVLIMQDLDFLKDDFIDERLIDFVGKELEMKETAEKIRRFYKTPADFDATIQMLISEAGYFDEDELNEFQERLVLRRKKSGPERLKDRADVLKDKKRYALAIRTYRQLLSGPRDGRLSAEFYTKTREDLANCFGKLFDFDRAVEILKEVYEETKEARILKKIYDIMVLSGQGTEDEVFKDLSKETLRLWQMDYLSRESAARTNLDEDPGMRMFLKEQELAEKEIIEYAEDMKDSFRGMLE